MPTFAIRSRRVLLPAGLQPATVVLRDGVIAHVGDDAAPGVPMEDLGDDVLAPSLVDTHVHVNEPGRTEWEGFATATRAAARGGITALVDMPLNCSPVTTTVDALERKLAACSGKLWVDTAFWGGVIPGNARELAPMVQRGVVGFKAFLCHSGIDEFPGSSEADLLRAMSVLAPLSVPLLAHCELDDALMKVPESASPSEYRTYLHSRPREGEDRAIALLIALSRQTGCPVHVVHLSSATALPMIREAKAQGVPITVETCPHYLCLSAEDVPDGATAFKCAPPIREGSNREELWKGLVEGVIDMVVTDHSPCVPGLKLPDTGDFLQAWGGIASLQLGLSAVWTEARRRSIPMQHVLGWLSDGPRALAGWPAARGVRQGAAADLMAWRPERTFEVHEEDLVQRHPVSPWIGRHLAGDVHATWLRGHRILRDGRLEGPPHGRTLLGRQT
ncbi:MAG: allantoinase AllB [Myxococcales bacterium]|nr:allantoinase AllB [Myxococcales bacterium]